MNIQIELDDPAVGKFLYDTYCKGKGITENNNFMRGYEYFGIYLANSGEVMASFVMKNSPYYEQAEVVTLQKFINRLKEYKKPVTFEYKLNKELTAVVLGDSIKVGCQTFEVSTILEFADEIRQKRGGK